jgi:zinc protease
VNLRTLLPPLLLALSGCGSNLATTRALSMRDVSFPLRDMRFPSGLRVVIEEDHRTPTVGVFTVVGSGSTSDPPGKEGLAHYVEHLAFRARPDGKTSVWHLLQRAGAGAWNGATGFDETTFYEVGPKEALPGLLLLEGVRLLAPTRAITKETADVEREVVRSELRQRNETGYDGPILGFMQAAVFPADHPYSRPVIGTHESLSAITFEDAEGFAKAHYRPENMTIVIVGDVDLKAVGSVVEESLPAELRAGKPGVAIAPRMPVKAPEPVETEPGPMLRREAAVATPEIWLGWSLPRGFDGDSYIESFAQGMAASAISGAFWSDSDIVGARSSLVRGKEASLMLVKVSLATGAHPESSANHALNRLVGLWMVTSDSGERTRQETLFVSRQRSAVTAMMLDAESLVARGSDRAEFTHFSGDPGMFSKELRATMKLDFSHVIDFSYRYLTRERARVVLVSPPPGGAAAPPSTMSAGSAPLDDLGAATFDAATVRAFMRPPGVREYRNLTLPNGLEVVIGRRAGLPVVTVGLSFHGGAATSDPIGAMEVADQLATPRTTWQGEPAEFGAHLRSYGTRESFEYVYRGSSGNVANMIASLGERVRSMHVTSHQMVVYGRDILPFLARAELRPEIVADRAFSKALFGELGYGRVATAKDLEAVREGDVTRWLDATHVPRNAVLAIVGEIDPDAVARLVVDELGGWSSDQAAQAPPAAPTIASGPGTSVSFVVTPRPGATQSQLRFGCLLPPPDRGSLAQYDLAANVSQEQLTDIVRRKLGASYGFHGAIVALRGGATELVVQGDVETASTGRALAAMREALTSFAQGKLDSQAIDRARLRLASHFGVAFDTTRSLVSAILDARNRGASLASIDAYAEDLIRPSPAEIGAVFARCLAGRPVVSIVGDEPAVRAAITEAWP